MAQGGMTKVRQQKAVGEGLAVGLLALGVEAVTTENMAIEFAFRKAWRTWSAASRFPQINARVERDDIMRIIHKNPGRRGPRYVDWVRDGPMYLLEPQQDWPVEQLSDFLADDVSHGQWVELARAFVAGLKDHEYRRFEQ